MHRSAYFIIITALASVVISPSAWAQTNSNSWGHFLFSIQINVDPPTLIASNEQVWCHARVLDGNFGPVEFVDGNAEATQLAPNVYRCDFNIPFFWFSGNSQQSAGVNANALVVNAANTNPTLAALSITRNAANAATGMVVSPGNNGNVHFPLIEIHL